ncbi:MAG: glycerol-3-phosphate dehydrogenase [Thermoleophilaceae bacterium]|nr:glycerol-3-phosphate dehydrogenase [Thermoleophilaceae bacterium]
MSDSSLHEAGLSVHHARTRDRGVQPVVLWITRFFLKPFLMAYFRVSKMGREHVPTEGAVILAANHRSFLDPFVVGLLIKRPTYFVAKKELFDRRFAGWFLNCVGAFPIRRGESDEESLDTAKAILARGDALMIFPEGTRIREGSLGKPKRGVGRLALESGAPVIPIAVHGTERARRGWRLRPVKVKVRFGRPLTFPRVEDPAPSLANEVTARIWPCIELQWEWLGGLPPLRKAAVIGAGSMGTGVATLLARAGLEVQLGCRASEQAERIAEAGRNDRYLPSVELPEGVTASTVADIQFAGVDLVVFAVPASALPAVVGGVGAHLSERSAVLMLSKGLVPPLGALPSSYVEERVKARAIACLGGPFHSGEAVARGAAAVVASTDRDFLRQLGDALDRAGIDVERTDDVVGVELAGAAKNAAALAASAAATSGMNAAGAAGGRVFSELERLGAALGAKPGTFTGVAGIGDLIATVLAPHSRNRQAGELLGSGMPAATVTATLGGTSEGIESAPLLAAACARQGVDAPATAALSALVEGRIAPERWIEDVRAGGRRAA